LSKGFRVITIDSKSTHPDAAARLRHARSAAAIAHTLILAKMREIGRAAGRELTQDPTNGYLANLDPDDYKKFFRPFLPQAMKGGDFNSQFSSAIESGIYNVQGAADHHVLEARRVRQFRDFVEQSAQLPLEDRQRFILMDKAGHLMYASHLSSMNDAQLGSDECDLLVNLVRSREKAGLYGARMTGGGCGGAVAVLCEMGETPDRAIAEILKTYEQRTKRVAQVL
jgi:L-arabinokinase